MEPATQVATGTAEITAASPRWHAFGFDSATVKLVLAGAILGDQATIDEHYRDLLRHTGPSLSAFNAWVCLKGLETLDLRVRRENDSAEHLAALIAAHPKARRVFYPTRPDHPQHAAAMKQMTGGGSVLAFDMGDRAAAWRVLDALQIIDISNNIGDSKSLACHPASTTHNNMGPEGRAEMGIGEGMIRLNVGLEDPQDLIEDLDRAFAKAGL